MRPPDTRPRPPTTVGWETAAVVGAAMSATLLSALLWVAGELAGWLRYRRWPAVPPSEALGVLLRLPQHLADPAAAWPVAVRAQLAGPLLLGTVAAVLAAVAAGGFAVIVVLLPSARLRRLQQERDGSPSWNRRGGVRTLLVSSRQPGRVVLGRLGRRLVAAEPRRSVMVVAPTQAGKTTRFVIPTVLTWHGPMLVTSVKTDVLHLTLATRRHRGQAHVFDPTGATGLPSVKWSPVLAAVDYPAAERVASWLVEAGGDPRGENARFWESLAAKLLGPLLLAAAYTGGGMRQVASWVDRRQTEEVSDVLEAVGDPDALDAWIATCAREDRQRDSVYGTAESVLRAFASPSARAATHVTRADHLAGNVLDVGRLVRAGETLYVVAPAHEQLRLRPLFEALVQDVIRAAEDAYAASGRPLDPPLLLMLDEAANIAPLRELARHAATGAGQGIQLCTVWQDLAQVEALYGRQAATVVNGHTARVFLTGSADVATLDATSRMIGEHEVARVSTTVGADGRRSASEATQSVRIAPVEYLRQLPADTAVVLYGSAPAMRLRTVPWYADRAIRRLVHSPAGENTRGRLVAPPSAH